MGEEHEDFISTLWTASQPPNKVGFHLFGRAYVPPNDKMLGSIWLFVIDASRLEITWEVIQGEGYWVPLYTVANTSSSAHTAPTITEIGEVMLDSPQHNSWTNFAMYSADTQTYNFLVADPYSIWNGIFTFPAASNGRMITTVVETVFNRLKEALCLAPAALTGATRPARSLASQRRQRQLLKKGKAEADIVKAASHGKRPLGDIDMMRWSSRAVILDQQFATWRVVYWDTEKAEWTEDIDWQDELAFVLRALHMCQHSQPSDLPANILAITLDIHDSSPAMHTLISKVAIAHSGDSQRPNVSSSDTSASEAAAREPAVEDTSAIDHAPQVTEHDELPAADSHHQGNVVHVMSEERQADVEGPGHEQDKPASTSNSGAATSISLTDDVPGETSKTREIRSVQEECEARLHSAGPPSLTSPPPSQSASRPCQRLTRSRAAEIASSLSPSVDLATKGPSHGVLGLVVASPSSSYSPPGPKAKRIKRATDVEEEPDFLKLYTTLNEDSDSDKDAVQQPRVEEGHVDDDLDIDLSNEDDNDAESEKGD